MPTESFGAVTQLLQTWTDGDEGALERLTPLVEETASVPHVLPDMVKRDWRLAKLWMLRELDGATR